MEALGGFNAVVADESKMQEVVQSLSVGNRVTLAVLKKHEEQVNLMSICNSHSSFSQNDRLVPKESD